MKNLENNYNKSNLISHHSTSCTASSGQIKRFARESQRSVARRRHSRAGKKQKKNTHARTMKSTTIDRNLPRKRIWRGGSGADVHGEAEQLRRTIARVECDFALLCRAWQRSENSRIREQQRENRENYMNSLLVN